jgi:pimeloyl-ACP methyl ester carboxylesterase
MQTSWRSPDLGAQHEIDLPQGRLRYHERGAGPPMVFAHGWLANANLWRKVVASLAERFCCITLDLPLGAHTLAMPADADLTPSGCGRLIATFLEARELSEVTLVGNDSGGAYSQIATAAAPMRVGRLVLNACETPYDPWPPPAFAGLQQAARTPEALQAALGVLRDRAVRSSPLAFGHLAKRPIEDPVMDSYVLPLLEDAEVARDASKVIRSASQRDVEAAAARLIDGFPRPILFAWAAEDRFFPLEHARRYAATLPDARVEQIEDAYSFVPEDQPARLAELLGSFAAKA